MAKGGVLRKGVMKVEGSLMPGRFSAGDPVRDTLDFWLLCRLEKGFSPSITPSHCEEEEAGSETLMKTSQAKRNTDEGLCPEFVALT